MNRITFPACSRGCPGYITPAALAAARRLGPRSWGTLNRLTRHRAVRGITLLASILAAASSATTIVRAAEAADLEKLFPKEADVVLTRASRTGLVRVDLPAPVLAECRPDLSDLRLFDRDGKEVPFLVDSLSPSASLESKQRFAARVVEYFREEVHRESGPPLRRESFILRAPGRVAETGSWVLVLETDRPEFVCRVQVLDASGGRTRTLVDHGSLFRVPQSGHAEKTRLALPAFSAERLRVILESEDSFWLAPTFRFESAGVLERGGRIAIPLEALTREAEEGVTVVDLARPRGVVPDLLRIETSTDAFDRKVEVWDAGPGIPQEGGTPLASAKLFRLKTLAPVEELEMSLRPAQGDRLRVRIEDRDSPPLENLVVTAVVRQPSLIFPFPSTATGTSVGTLRFGGGRAYLPSYDLAGFFPPPAGALAGARGRAAAALYDRSALGEGRLGEIRPNTRFDRAPALGFAMRPGREIDAGRYSHARTLTVPGSPEGLVRLPLTPADLAVMREDLSDVRIVNRASRQWPYLLERDASTALVEVRIEGPVRRHRASRYHLRPVTAPVRLERLVLQTESGFFDRAFRLTGIRPDKGEDALVSGRLVRGRNDRHPISIVIPPRQLEALDLDVEDGDDAPLAFTFMRGRALLPAIYLAAPAGEYTLLMGDPEGTSPRYELERVRDVVLAVRSAPAAAGDLEPNPHFSMTARLAGDGRKQQVLLWVALGAAVITLLVLTLRLVRRQTPAPG